MRTFWRRAVQTILMCAGAILFLSGAIALMRQFPGWEPAIGGMAAALSLGWTAIVLRLVPLD